MEESTSTGMTKEPKECGHKKSFRTNMKFFIAIKSKEFHINDLVLVCEAKLGPRKPKLNIPRTCPFKL